MPFHSLLHLIFSLYSNISIRPSTVRRLPSALILLLLPTIFFAQVDQAKTKSALEVIGLEMDQSEVKMMQARVKGYLDDYEAIRAVKLENSIPPALQFNPTPIGFEPNYNQKPIDWKIADKLEIPASEANIAFAPLPLLAAWIKSGKISSVQLTELYLRRLKKYGDTLQCVVTMTEDLALKQAQKADEELSNGIYRGPLHGIPYGIKDLFAVPDYKTSWGARPYKDQKLNMEATVVEKLEEAGAVLLAKLTLGALAWGDVWFGGKTKNPWNLEQGSSGSSAGSASATAAGLVGFSIGTETLGSIVSPSTRCGNSGLRPTFGRVSRYGAMALSWSMDKVGPICRSLQGCAMVFDAIRGADGLDQTVINPSFNFQEISNLRNLRVGYIKSAFDNNRFNQENDSLSLEVFRKLGAELIPVELPDNIPIRELGIILSAEAAAAFDVLTRTHQDSLLVRQIENAWPNVFRSSRLIPAVEYIQANRHRYQLIQQMHKVMKELDVLISPTFGNKQLTLTNLTGHPCAVFPNGFNNNGSPTSISLIGNLFDEATLLAVGILYQKQTKFDDLHPQLFK